MEKAFRIIVYGRVQGVFFRQNAKEMADHLGLTGQAMNLPDGSVEILASGPELPLTNFINYLKQGNGSAKVDSVEVTELKDFKGPDGFTIK